MHIQILNIIQDAMLAISLPLMGVGILASIYGILAFIFNWE